jgi:hypothetical protein
MAPIIDKLDDNNYPYWSRYMEGRLMKIDGWRIVTGEQLCPAGKGATGWNKRRDPARAELLLHVSEKYITYCVIILF